MNDDIDHLMGANPCRSLEILEAGEIAIKPTAANRALVTARANQSAGRICRYNEILELETLSSSMRIRTGAALRLAGHVDDGEIASESAVNGLWRLGRLNVPGGS